MSSHLSRSLTRTAVTALVALPLLATSAALAVAVEEEPSTAPDESQDGAEVAASEPVSFVDTEGRAYEDAVAALAEEGVVQGCGEGLFCPHDLLTRGQVATVLVNALGLAPLEAGPFTDTQGSVHESAINRIAVEGITVGCEEARFCPSEVMTREQAATMLVRAFETTDTDGSFFDDLGATHGDNVDRLAAEGIVAGCGDPLTAFCPREPVQRWHAAVFVARAMELIAPAELAPLEERRAEQERIDAEREAERQAELEAERQAEEERRAAERLAMWESLAECESNGRWDANTGNGYYGGLQFHIETWRGVGGSGYPHQASKAEQIHRAEVLLTRSWATFGNQWPACSRMLGLS